MKKQLHPDSAKKEQEAYTFARFLVYADLIVRKHHCILRRYFLSRLLHRILHINRKHAFKIVATVTNSSSWIRTIMPGSFSEFHVYDFDFKKDHVPKHVNRIPINLDDVYNDEFLKIVLNHDDHPWTDDRGKEDDILCNTNNFLQQAVQDDYQQTPHSRSMMVLASTIDNCQEDILQERKDQSSNLRNSLVFIRYWGKKPLLKITPTIMHRMSKVIHHVDTDRLKSEAKQHTKKWLYICIRACVLIFILTIPATFYHFFRYLRYLGVLKYLPHDITSGIMMIITPLVRYYVNNITNISIIPRLVLYAVFEIVFDVTTYHQDHKNNQD